MIRFELSLTMLLNGILLFSIISHIFPLKPCFSEHKEKIGEIFVTLDSHHKKHIAHQAFWSSIENDVANKGDEPAADCSVEITEDDLLAGKWFPKDCSLQVQYSNFYFC